MVKVTKNSIVFLLGAVIFDGFCMQQHGLTNAHTCGDSQALLEVLYDDPSWDGGDKIKVHVTGSSPQVGSTVIAELDTTYPANATFDFHTCIPRDDTCGHIAVVGPPRDMYEILWDGQVLTDTETGPELMDSGKDDFKTPGLLTVTQFGNACTSNVECESTDEALFTFQYRNRGRYSQQIGEGFFVQDQNGNIVMSEYKAYDGPKGSMTLAGLYATSMCLPKNNCYNLVTASAASSPQIDSKEHLFVSFGNETLYDDGSFVYESIDFGDTCTLCNPDEESTLEFLMVTDDNSQRSPMSWELVSVVNSTYSEVTHSGIQSSDTSVTLHHEKFCVPKGTCMVFSVIPPSTSSNDTVTNTTTSVKTTSMNETANETDFDDVDTTNVAEYMLRMDGIIYREVYPSSSFMIQRSPDTILGDCAQKDEIASSKICNPDNEMLLELNFHTIAKPISSSNSFSYNDTNPKVQHFDHDWSVSEMVYQEDANGTEYLDPVKLYDASNVSHHYHYFNTSYTSMMCIPNTECLYSLLVLNNKNDTSMFETYSIKINGEDQVTEEGNETKIMENILGDAYEVAAINCNENGLSGITLAAIAIGSLVGAGLLYVGAFYLNKHRKKNLNAAVLY